MSKQVDQVEIVSASQLDEKKLKKIKELFPKGTELNVSVNDKHFKKHVYVTSVRKLDETNKNLLIKKFGENVEYHFDEDSSLIGGIIIRTKDKLYDGSIKTKLSQLSQSLN